MSDLWCDICDRDLVDIPAEVRALYRSVCVQCWIESVDSGMHTVDDLPVDLRPLRKRG